MGDSSPHRGCRRGIPVVSTATVFVHLDYDVWDHRETEAIRVSRHGRADVYLPQGQRATGQWDGANTAAVAGSIAHRYRSSAITATSCRHCRKFTARSPK